MTEKFKTNIAEITSMQPLPGILINRKLWNFNKAVKILHFENDVQLIQILWVFWVILGEFETEYKAP
jgi:hypothetical protein